MLPVDAGLRTRAPLGVQRANASRADSVDRI